MYRITNTALDYSREMLRRTASKMVMEPMIATKRLMLRSSMELSDILYGRNKEEIDRHVKHGVVSVVQLSVDDPSIDVNLDDTVEPTEATETTETPVEAPEAAPSAEIKSSAPAAPVASRVKRK